MVDLHGTTVAEAVHIARDVLRETGSMQGQWMASNGHS